MVGEIVAIAPERSTFADNMAARRRISSQRIPDYVVNSWRGINTIIKSSKDLLDGVSPDSLNWITGYDPDNKKGDHIELRRGYALLGQTRVNGTGKVTGLGIGTRYDGTQIPFYTAGRKIKYYDPTANDVAEVGLNLLPAAADGEYTSIAPYQNLAGSFVYVSSPSSSIYKIHTANPASAVDQSSASYRGYISFVQGRMQLWNRNGSAASGKDLTGYYESYIDKALLSSFTHVTGESVGTGDGVTKTFAGTLAQRTGARTLMYIQITDSVETLVDNRNGTLVGSLGGTGTINYATGAYSVTFNTAPTNPQAITADYYWEDSTSAGVCDFSQSSPRTAGQGNVFRQDDGGANLNSVLPLGPDIYCLHTLRTWVVTNTLTDTSATNLPYRNNTGTPFYLGAFSTGDGILYLDNSRPSSPKLNLLGIPPGSTNTTIVPMPLSDDLDLSLNAFDSVVVRRWGNYDIICCQNFTNGVKDTFNSVFYIRNIISGFWDKLDYPASCLDEYLGTLLSGDSLSSNLFTLFSGFDDDGNVINNHWISGMSNLKYDGSKKLYRMVIEGLIAPAQSFDIYLSFDGGQFVKYRTIAGTGTYVSKGAPQTIGTYTLGSKVLGAGGSGPITAYPYLLDFPIASDLFEYVQVKFVATGIGYLEVDQYTFKDIRAKGRHLLPTQTA